MLVWSAGASLTGLVYHGRCSCELFLPNDTHWWPRERGGGKTLSMALTVLLDHLADHQIIITISLLTEVSSSHPRIWLYQEIWNTEREFMVECKLQKFTIQPLLVITQHRKNSAHRYQDTRDSTAPHHDCRAVVQETWGSPSSPRYARLLMRQNQFSRWIARINVNEVHCIHSAELPQYSLPPFRPAWGKLRSGKKWQAYLNFTRGMRERR